MGRWRGWLDSSVDLGDLEPEVQEAHRALLLSRTRSIAIVALGVLPFTVLAYFYVNHRELMGQVLPLLVISETALFVLIWSLKLKFFQRHYHLPVFILTGVICNFAESTLFPLTQTGHSFFLFPYLLMDFGVATFLPGALPWIAATLAVLPPTYFMAEWLSGADVASAGVTSNLIYLIDVAAMAVIGNQIILSLFVREKRHQLQLHAANERLKDLDQAKSSFFANISHELKTPMTLVLSPLECLLGNSSAGAATVPAPRKTIELVRQNAYRLAGMIGDLLDLARSELGSARLNPIAILKPTEYFNAAAASLAPLCEQKGVRFQIDIAPDLASHEFDREKIDKVLVNLVANAAKFTPAGGVVQVRIADEDGVLHLAVADTGIGIPKENLAQVFERFMQVDPSSTRAYGGMGIGLSLVKEFIEQHGGSVRITSELGEGTTVTVTLPRGREHFRVPVVEGTAEAVARIATDLPTLVRAHASLRREAPADTAGPAAPESAERLLIVDDLPDMHVALQSVLVGFRMAHAYDGEEALAHARRVRPDLIISDIMMPKKDGYQLLRDLKADPVLRNIPVILLTAKTGEEQLALGFSAGADDYIVKPFQPKEVLARVGNLLKCKRQTEALAELNRSLQATRQELLQAEKLSTVGVLAAGMAHELNNPVAAIRTYVQDLLEDQSGESPLRQRLEGIERATARCKRIVGELLTFARQPVVGEPCAVNPIVQKISALAQHECVDGRIRVVTDLAPDIPTLPVDAMQLEQVVANLVHNARDAIPGCGAITIHTRRRNGMVEITVEDTGTGIAPEHLAKVFDPFFTTKAPGKGMGLGLAISYNIVKRYEGELNVESAPGRGSMFTLRFPVPAPSNRLHKGDDHDQRQPTATERAVIARGG